jgi:hypothetical protein
MNSGSSEQRSSSIGHFPIPPAVSIGWEHGQLADTFDEEKLLKVIEYQEKIDKSKRSRELAKIAALETRLEKKISTERKSELSSLAEDLVCSHSPEVFCRMLLDSFGKHEHFSDAAAYVERLIDLFAQLKISVAGNSLAEAVVQLQSILNLGRENNNRNSLQLSDVIGSELSASFALELKLLKSGSPAASTALLRDTQVVRDSLNNSSTLIQVMISASVGKIKHSRQKTFCMNN